MVGQWRLTFLRGTKGVVHNRVCLYSVSGNGGDGGWGDFELVSKSEKVRKCLKNKN